MGRLIDADKLKDILEYAILANVSADNTNTNEEKWNDWIQSVIDRTPTVEAIPKADYEARLKAYMVDMLTEIQLEIEEKKRDELSYQQTWNYPLNVCVSIIQQKIDELKEKSNG